MAVGRNKAANPNRILTIKFSSIGDIVLTTSPIKTLKDIFPNAKIDILTRSDFVPLLEGLKYIDNIISFERSAGFGKLIKTGKWINNSNYDLIIDFHNSLRSNIIKMVVRNKIFRSLKKPRLLRFLLFRFRKNLFSTDFSQLQLLHKPIANMVSDSDFQSPELFVSEQERHNSDELLKIKSINSEYIALIPGAAWSQKTWSAQNYHDLILKIKEIKNVDFVILGGRNDRICLDLASYDKSYLNLQGETNLRESMAIIANAKFCIGADTGFIHAAEALGKDVVLILGPTSRETGAGINRESSVLIQNDKVWCRPCSQNGKRKCYRDQQYCMTTITPEIVLQKMRSLLN